MGISTTFAKKKKNFAHKSCTMTSQPKRATSFKITTAYKDLVELTICGYKDYHFPHPCERK